MLMVEPVGASRTPEQPKSGSLKQEKMAEKGPENAPEKVPDKTEEKVPFAISSKLQLLKKPNRKSQGGNSMNSATDNSFSVEPARAPADSPSSHVSTLHSNSLLNESDAIEDLVPQPNKPSTPEAKMLEGLRKKMESSGKSYSPEQVSHKSTPRGAGLKVHDLDDDELEKMKMATSKLNFKLRQPLTTRSKASTSTPEEEKLEDEKEDKKQQTIASSIKLQNELLANSELHYNSSNDTSKNMEEEIEDQEELRDHDEVPAFPLLNFGKSKNNDGTCASSRSAGNASPTSINQQVYVTSSYTSLYDSKPAVSKNFKDGGPELDKMAKLHHTLSNKKASSTMQRVKSLDDEEASVFGTRKPRVDALGTSRGVPLSAISSDSPVYTLTEDLEEFDRTPQVADVVDWVNSLGKKSREWSDHFQSLDAIRKVIKFNPELMPKDKVRPCCVMVLALVDNLRSALAKNALICLHDLIQKFNKQLDIEVEQCVNTCIRKAADTNSFLQEEADRACVAICNRLTESKILPVVFEIIATSKNPLLKTKAGRCVGLLVARLSKKSQLQSFSQLDKLVTAIGNLIGEASGEARQMGRGSLSLLRKGLLDQAGLYDLLIKRHMSDSVILKVKSLSDAIEMDEEAVLTGALSKSSATKATRASMREGSNASSRRPLGR
eukprot:Platyproteum_vivax@DN7503_c0_g1_i1.p2